MSTRHHPAPLKTPPSVRVWNDLLPYFIALLISVGTVVLLSIFFPSFMRCTPLNDVPSWLGQAFFLGISQALPHLFNFGILKSSKGNASRQKNLVALTVAAGLATFFFMRFGLPAPDEIVCYPQLKVIYGLIDAEKNAVLTRDMNKIESIYSPDAVIENIALNRKWGNPSLYYGPKFNEEVHCSLTHSQYTRIKLTSTEAIITTASAGTWGKTASNNGCTEVYNNPAGSDYWVFSREDSRWVISDFRFNCYAAPERCQP